MNKEKRTIKQKSERLYELSLYLEYASIAFVIDMCVCIILGLTEPQHFLQYLIAGAVSGVAFLFCRAASANCFYAAGSGVWRKTNEVCEKYAKHIED